MLVGVGLSLLCLWVVSWICQTLGFYDVGTRVHFLLLAGLMVLLLGALKARDAAAERLRSKPR